jgi:hypothetical protein
VIHTIPLGIIWNLAALYENKVIMGSSESELLTTLVEVLSDNDSEDHDTVTVKICGALRNLAVATENRLYMASPQLGLLQSLIKIVEDYNNDLAVTKACGAIRNIAALASPNKYLVIYHTKGMNHYHN